MYTVLFPCLETKSCSQSLGLIQSVNQWICQCLTCFCWIQFEATGSRLTYKLNCIFCVVLRVSVHITFGRAENLITESVHFFLWFSFFFFFWLGSVGNHGKKYILWLTIHVLEVSGNNKMKQSLIIASICHSHFKKRFHFPEIIIVDVIKFQHLADLSVYMIRQMRLLLLNKSL